MHKQVKSNIITSHNLSSLPTIHSHHTRSSANLNYYVPTVRLDLSKTSFNYCGPMIWNSLPKEIKNASTAQFKILLRQYLLKNYLLWPSALCNFFHINAFLYSAFKWCFLFLLPQFLPYRGYNCNVFAEWSSVPPMKLCAPCNSSDCYYVLHHNSEFDMYIL